MKPGHQRVVLEIDKNLHRAIKLAATFNHTTMRGWLIKVIAKALEEEKDHRKSTE